MAVVKLRDRNRPAGRRAWEVHDARLPVAGKWIARPQIANNDLPQILKRQNGPDRECTYCNKCLLNDLENPLGCYEVSRYPGASFEEQYENMIRTVMSVFDPPTYADATELEAAERSVVP